ncbi:MAG: peptidoglycan-binding domain-containing protein [Acidimicrobiia bacterium]
MFCLAAILLVPPPLASASDVAPVDYHTLSRGSRGVVVRALQYLLKHCGYSLTVDGAFGSTTEARVKSFQSLHGLANDGVVGPATWAEMVVTTSQGASGNRVSAITTLLNKWDGAGVTSSFTSTVKTRVQNFQNHRGLTSDGVVGPTTWKHLVFHYEEPAPYIVICRGLTGGVDTADPDEAWGTSQTVAFLEYAGNEVYVLYVQRVAFRDLSYEHGGTFHDGQHESHRYGMDIDIRPMTTVAGNSGYQCNTPTSNPDIEYWESQYNLTKTKFLAQSLRNASVGLGRDLHKITYFNDPLVINSVPEVQALENHDDHLHTRFCTAYYSYSSSYDC